MDSPVLFAFALTLFAGLSTGIGSLIGFLSKKFNPKLLTISLGFSAGVMIYVSMIEIFVKAKDSLSLALGEKQGYVWTVISFFLGIFVIALIDKVIPSYENPHELNVGKKIESASEKEKAKLLRMGAFSALAIGIHNFPEGLATFMSGLTNPTLGISIAAAIAIHNIPEGLAVSAPIYYATKSRRKAFFLSFLSGLAEPVGALIGYFILRSFFNETMFGVIFAAVAGIMVYISLDELLPTAEEFGEHHLAIGGLIAGMITMAVSLLLFI
ncbi:MAG: zinc transporter ZupT [Thermotogae bacterium]|nr:zinc transporter ZupT [Thermotogota bacterium]HOZ11329.1 zinc transporter ZupT [Thermotogota bacterium]HPH12146.1 zinc transporter ZupT [Thermotogota bacterium]HQN21111.1 zinc transporter ZupT [Thermotogota bacterium]